MRLTTLNEDNRPQKLSVIFSPEIAKKMALIVNHNKNKK